MKQRISILIVFLVVVAIAQVAPQESREVPLPTGSAKIVDFKGDVQIHGLQGASLSSLRGQVLAPETIIETGKGSIVLDLQDGSQVLVQDHSRVTLKAPASSGGQFLQEWLGKLLIKAQKRLGGTPSFRMGTPTAVISVRGTKFEVAVGKNHETAVSVFEGMVEVSSSGGAGGVMLSPGFTTTVHENRQPETPRDMHLPVGGVHSAGGNDQRYKRGDDSRERSRTDNPSQTQQQPSGTEWPEADSTEPF